MATGGSGTEGNSPFAWLGLLKWSLAFSDGTAPSDVERMSEEDVAFLEKVMSEGIIDEGERMKSILKDVTGGLEIMLGANITADGSGDGESKQEEKRKELEEDEMLELLQELRDIVEQIDYARAFMAMGGIPFLLGCATYHAAESAADRTIPKSIRKGALGVLSTMCQNNPPVQLSLLEHGHMPQLIQLFFDYTTGNDCGNDGDDSIREKVVQALSASIRGHSMAEHIFCQNEQGKVMLQLGLGMQQKAPKPSSQLRKRSLFLLRALLTSDDATNERHELFQDVISFICTHEINEEWEEDAEIREMSLSMLSQLLLHNPAQSKQSSSQERVSKTILQHKNYIGGLGVNRIQAIRNLKEGSEEREYATLELEEWERMMVALAEAENEGASDVPQLEICDMYVPP
eukprot:CAMPEP_0172308832 /NCGR_PEP_ID=MMETSP1058-20130122/9312_1 /TAXON_ID=83371 /ORGANISM="Detonula confervacea, Strain CCMP 353" /LENGTH=402 /DNA_ID=CAMNT_0013021341 /DNA_START=23 /DNA_END=1231 /DNA_ORIENTATION=+